MKNYDLLTDALSDLRARGYAADFETASFCLYCGDLDIRLNPEAFHIDETYRFEGDAATEDNFILYAITSSTGLKGTLVYGAYSEKLNFEMAQKLHSHSQCHINSIQHLLNV